MRYFVMIGVLGAVACVLVAIFSSSAPQMAAWSALACALAVVPYVGWRIDQLYNAEKARDRFCADVIRRMDAMDQRKS